MCIKILSIFRNKTKYPTLDSFPFVYTAYKFMSRELLLENFNNFISLKGIVQPFELGGETRLIRSAVK